jgi:hypothetical protein
MNKSWGSHPLTDRLFSSGSFQIIHDAAQYRRDTKLKKLEQWPQAFRNLRVCWSAPRKDENCGRCIKCILTALAALSRLLPLPESFPQEPTEHALLQLRDLDDEHTDLLERILKHPNSSNLPARLLHAIERCTKYNRRRLELEKPAKNQIAKRVRSFALGLHDWRGP